MVESAILLTVSGFATVLEMPSVQYADAFKEEEEKALGKMFVTRTLLLASMKMMHTEPRHGCQQTSSMGPS